MKKDQVKWLDLKSLEISISTVILAVAMTAWSRNRWTLMCRSISLGSRKKIWDMSPNWQKKRKMQQSWRGRESLASTSCLSKFKTNSVKSKEKRSNSLTRLTVEGRTSPRIRPSRSILSKLLNYSKRQVKKRQLNNSWKRPKSLKRCEKLQKRLLRRLLQTSRGNTRCFLMTSVWEETFLKIWSMKTHLSRILSIGLRLTSIYRGPLSGKDQVSIW